MLAACTIAVAGGLLAGGTALVIGAADRNAGTVNSAITAVVPADADTFVVAPASKTWWAKVTAMDTFTTRLTGLDPADAGATISRIGYSRSPDHVQREIPKTGPLRFVYIESPTTADATKVADWLKKADGFDGRRVYQAGQVVIVTPGWVTTYMPPQQSMATVAAYKPQARTTEATMWLNVDQQVPSVAVGDANASAMRAMLHSAYGFKDATTWIGNSGEGNTWKGGFTSGGVDGTRINFQQASSSLHATEKVLDGSTDAPRPPAPGSTSQSVATYQLIDPGASTVLATSTVVAKGQSSTLGTSRSGSAPLALGDSLVTSLVDVTQWNAAFSGTYSGQENVLTEAISATGTDMAITLTYKKQ